MNYEIKRTSQFKKDVKLMLKQGKDIQDLLDVVELLRTDTPCRTNAMTIPCPGIGSGNGNVTLTPTGC